MKNFVTFPSKTNQIVFVVSPLFSLSVVVYVCKRLHFMIICLQTRIKEYVIEVNVKQSTFKINTDKTKLLRICTTNTSKLKMSDAEIQDLKHYTTLVSLGLIIIDDVANLDVQ